MIIGGGATMICDCGEEVEELCDCHRDNLCDTCHDNVWCNVCGEYIEDENANITHMCEEEV